MAVASTPDSLAIVSAEGVLAHMERTLSEPASTTTAAGLLSIKLLATAAKSADPRVCTLVAQEPGLLLSLVRRVATASQAGVGRDGMEDASLVLETLATHTSLRAQCAAAVLALSDPDLDAWVCASARCAVPTLAMLFTCLDTEPFLRRLVGFSGLPLALATILVEAELEERQINNAGLFLNRLMAGAANLNTVSATWAKPMVKKLMRSAFTPAARASLARVQHASDLLRMLSSELDLLPSIANGLPDLVSVLRGGGACATSIADTLVNLVVHPGARAAALREGAVPALVSLLHGSQEDDVAVAAFRALGAMSNSEDSRAAVRTTADALVRLQDTMGRVIVPALSRHRPPFIFPLLVALNEVSHLLPVRALVDTGARARAVQLCGSRDDATAVFSIGLLLSSGLKWAEPEDVASWKDDCRIALRAFSTDARAPLASKLSNIFLQCMCSWTRVPHEPQMRPLLFSREGVHALGSAGGRALAELLVADAFWVTLLCAVTVMGSGDAFVNDLSATNEINLAFDAGRLLHYLDSHAGPAVKRGLVKSVVELSLQPELRRVRNAAGRGRWGMVLF